MAVLFHNCASLSLVLFQSVSTEQAAERFRVDTLDLVEWSPGVRCSTTFSEVTQANKYPDRDLLSRKHGRLCTAVLRTTSQHTRSTREQSLVEDVRSA